MSFGKQVYVLVCYGSREACSVSTATLPGRLLPASIERFCSLFNKGVSP